VIYRTFPLAQASEAHKLMESSQHTGKIVLTL
jgi:NADPH:quinone reductase-like Zn-dependent oxidoreductase